jgi:hypothetical protein
MNSHYLVYCYDCSRSICSSEDGLQVLINNYGDYFTCSCGNKIKLRLTKYDLREFKLKKVKDRIG